MYSDLENAKPKTHIHVCASYQVIAKMYTEPTPTTNPSPEVSFMFIFWEL